MLHKSFLLLLAFVGKSVYRFIAAVNLIEIVDLELIKTAAGKIKDARINWKIYFSISYSNATLIYKIYIVNKLEYMNVIIAILRIKTVHSRN